MSNIVDELDHTCFQIFDSVFDDIWCRFGASHLKNTIKLSLVTLMIFYQIQVSLLNDLCRVAEHFNSTFNSSSRLANIVKICIARFTCGLPSAALLETWQVKQRVLELFKVKLELVRACIANFLDLQ